MKKLYEESSVQAIADAIRAKAGTEDTYKIAEMPAAIANLPSGGGAAEPYVEEVYDSDGNLIEAKLYGYTKTRTNMFSGCTKLNLVSLPDGLASIESGTFADNYELYLTSLPAGLTKIDGAGFRNCYKLSITRLPPGIMSIGSYAFSSCKGTTSLTFEGTPQSINSYAFINNPQLTTINVPWAEGAVANAPWGATNATINYNYTEE